MNGRSRSTGLLLVIFGASFWGVGGTVAQKLFQEFGISVDWLVTARLLTAGILLLAVQFLMKDRTQVFGVWKNKRAAIMLLIFGLAGMLAVQYTYMASIHHGNAAVATLLQYLAPAMIIIYLVLRKQSVFSRQDFVTVSLALAGCFFLLTNGSVSQLSVPAPAIVWGVLSGVALAFYTLYAIPLLKEYDSLVVVGWAMVIGGSALSLIHPPWQMDFGRLTAEAGLYLFFVIIFGTMLAFWFYIESLQTLSPTETSLLSSLEPLAAVFTTVMWLNEPFGMFQWAGTACIFGMILLLALNKQKPAKNSGCAENEEPLKVS
ncbi:MULTISPECIES: DMT family transporter [Cytobacillus]|jgi:drug/metabolite transporter (DMT)-like permease|uniref:Transporter n=2 Tax=Cytobacillus TaxID=2675230 RepID=A0ABX3CR69_9BACI|nr:MULTISPECIES: EamA family transporter [Cytobacillus]MBY0156427.1 EamA family transporter [Cytobacillus firmus]MBU8732109.1 DMT family transporter [Cytobacillus oceanisediminis]MCM3246209.1 DMT family transporter [Cytobacillus oceanisediminis]MCM3392322.1 DMT family transporter [Cytobacillus oceanisediminis]MCM3404397.1 DMT family transporter [Cytobacillus oceanisediminis]